MAIISDDEAPILVPSENRYNSKPNCVPTKL